MKNLLVIVFLFFGVFVLYAQDPQFSQFYAAPSYLNPSFTGETVQSRLVLNYRYQWPSVPDAFTSYNFSYDQNLENLNSGLGVIATRDKAGTGGMRYTNVSGMYAYKFRVNNQVMVKPSVQLGYTIHDIDLDRLTFGSQLKNTTQVPNSTLYRYEKISYYDVSSGVLVYSSKYWLGIAVHHINRPNQTLIGGESALPMKYSFHGGTKFKPFKDASNQFIAASFNYKAQRFFDQLDLGAYYEYHSVVFGLWYRGIPLLKVYNRKYGNRDALTLLLGYSVNTLKIGYSYDLTVSPLVSNTGGAHEISLVYEFASEKKALSKRARAVPCPKF